MRDITATVDASQSSSAPYQSPIIASTTTTIPAATAATVTVATTLTVKTTTAHKTI